MIRFFKHLFICNLLFTSACAQNIITGYIKDSLTKAPIFGVTITLQSNGKISAYAIADADGMFILKKVQLNSAEDLIFSHINYSTQKISISRFKNNSIIKLNPQKNTLPEVLVSETPITQRGDTISYIVDKFMSKEDRVIGDLIKRLPGIAVSSTGLITFNGKAISNYYIEGLDLLEGKYNLANSNINIEAVDKVQILENNQPIKILDSSSIVTNPSLNIKLKGNAKKKLFKNIELNAGHDTTALLGVNINLMKFASKAQFIAGFKANNFGDIYENDIIEHYTLDNIDEIKKNEDKQPFLSLSKVSPPVINKTYTAFNKTEFFYFNGLRQYKTGSQLKISIDFYKNNQDYFFNKISNYYLPNNTVVVNENHTTNTNTFLLRSKIKYLINNPRIYLSNKLNFNFSDEKDNNSILAATAITQKLVSNYSLISNDLIIFKKIGKKLVELNAYLAFSNLPSQLQIVPGVYDDLYNNSLPYSSLIQNVNRYNVNTLNSISLKEKYGKLQFKHTFLISYDITLLISNAGKISNNVEMALNDSFTNKLVTNKFYTELNNTVSYSKRKLKIVINLPIQIGQVSIKDTVNQYAKSFGFFNPTYNLNYKLSQFFEIGLTTAYKKEIGNTASSASGIIATSYRNLQIGQNIIPIEETKPLSFSLNYKNIRKSIFAYINTSILYTKSNINLNQQYLGTTIINKFGLFNNRFKSNYIIANGSKYFREIKLTTSITATLSKSNINAILNGKNTAIKNNYSNYKIEMNTRVFKNIFIENVLNYTRSKSIVDDQISNKPFILLNNKFLISKLFGKVISLKSITNYYYSKLNQKNSWFFIDASVNFKFKKCDLSFSTNNIHNYKKFIWAEVTENMVVQNEYKLRRRNVLAKFIFRL